MKDNKCFDGSALGGRQRQCEVNNETKYYKGKIKISQIKESTHSKQKKKQSWEDAAEGKDIQ